MPRLAGVLFADLVELKAAARFEDLVELEQSAG